MSNIGKIYFLPERAGTLGAVGVVLQETEESIVGQEVHFNDGQPQSHTQLLRVKRGLLFFSLSELTTGESSLQKM